VVAAEQGRAPAPAAAAGGLLTVLDNKYVPSAISWVSRPMISNEAFTPSGGRKS
jgi:hypothetical protein